MNYIHKQIELCTKIMYHTHILLLLRKVRYVYAVLTKHNSFDGGISLDKYIMKPVINLIKQLAWDADNTLPES